jgi:predicted GNAT superfamily acetyltransferase
MSVEIRDIEALSDYDACAQLQIDVWGFEPIEVVPAGHLIAMHHYGGTCVGAFDGTRLIGFVCGFGGWDRARPFHHSHMLAVLPEYRGRHIGENLKWAQRDRVLAQGIELINWTFDPLQAPNANLNVNRLGCIARRYKVNLYGESHSPLHGGIPTDRFEAEWHLKDQRVLDARAGRFRDWPSWESLPRANRTRVDDDGLLACEPALNLDLDGEALLVEIPKKITEIMAHDRDSALDWRQRTRKIFQHYFEKGYRVEALHRADASAFYRLARIEDAAD